MWGGLFPGLTHQEPLYVAPKLGASAERHILHDVWPNVLYLLAQSLRPGHPTPWLRSAHLRERLSVYSSTSSPLLYACMVAIPWPRPWEPILW